MAGLYNQAILDPGSVFAWCTFGFGEHFFKEHLFSFVQFGLLAFFYSSFLLANSIAQCFIGVEGD